MSKFFLMIMTVEQWAKLFKSAMISAVAIATSVLAIWAKDAELTPMQVALLTGISGWLAGVVKTLFVDAVPLPAKVEKAVATAIATPTVTDTANVVAQIEDAAAKKLG